MGRVSLPKMAQSADDLLRNVFESRAQHRRLFIFRHRPAPRVLFGDQARLLTAIRLPNEARWRHEFGVGRDQVVAVARKPRPVGKQFFPTRLHALSPPTGAVESRTRYLTTGPGESKLFRYP